MRQFDNASATEMVNAIKEQLSMSPERIAKALGISTRTLYRIASGKEDCHGSTRKLLWVLCNSLEAMALCEVWREFT